MNELETARQVAALDAMSDRDIMSQAMLEVAYMIKRDSEGSVGRGIDALPPDVHENEELAVAHARVFERTKFARLKIAAFLERQSRAGVSPRRLMAKVKSPLE